jgi:hypothetical protein
MVLNPPVVRGIFAAINGRHSIVDAKTILHLGNKTNYTCHHLIL